MTEKILRYGSIILVFLSIILEINNVNNITLAVRYILLVVAIILMVISYYYEKNNSDNKKERKVLDKIMLIIGIGILLFTIVIFIKLLINTYF